MRLRPGEGKARHLRGSGPLESIRAFPLTARPWERLLKGEKLRGKDDRPALLSPPTGRRTLNTFSHAAPKGGKFLFSNSARCSSPCDRLFTEMIGVERGHDSPSAVKTDKKGGIRRGLGELYEAQKRRNSTSSFLKDEVRTSPAHTHTHASAQRQIKAITFAGTLSGVSLFGKHKARFHDSSHKLAAAGRESRNKAVPCGIFTDV